MSVFEPATVVAIIRNSLPVADRGKFVEKWNLAVSKRVASWKKHRIYQSQSDGQFLWAAHVVEYVDFVWKATRIHGNAKTLVSSSQKQLDKGVPLFGPRFVPPSHLHEEKRMSNLSLKPDSYYLKPLTVLHPFYYRELRELATCPVCHTQGFMRPDGWTATGYREVHGLYVEETALGYQLRCKTCESKTGKEGGDEGAGANANQNDSEPYCVATTSYEFWADIQPWELPRGVPFFFRRSAVTSELLDLILELRLSTTAGGLAENIKQLHLLEYHRRRNEYYSHVKQAVMQPSIIDICLTKFSDPLDTNGYGDSPISADLITDVYAMFSDRTRREESSEYLRSLPVTTLSIDATFKFAKKASVVVKTEEGTERITPMRGGVLSGINQSNETVVWRFCQTQAGGEATEMLLGVKHRCEALGINDPQVVTADNCCSVRAAVEAAMPETKVVLDVFHMKMRYLGTVQNGMKNPNYKRVGRDISDAILKTRAANGVPAQYWSQSEQEERLLAVFEKWSLHGGVWSASTQKVHEDQLRHVRKGCLARGQVTLATDGSRIEGSHKAWNSVMRAQPSGLETMHNCGHDLVLRRNIRIGSSTAERLDARPFLASSYGSHHIRLVNSANSTWNDILGKRRRSAEKAKLIPAPILPTVNSGEMFGIVHSPHATTFGGLLIIKEELEDELAELSLIGDDFDSIEADVTKPSTTGSVPHAQQLTSVPGDPMVAVPSKAGSSAPSLGVGSCLHTGSGARCSMVSANSSACDTENQERSVALSNAGSSEPVVSLNVDSSASSSFTSSPVTTLIAGAPHEIPLDSTGHIDLTVQGDSTNRPGTITPARMSAGRMRPETASHSSALNPKSMLTKRKQLDGADVNSISLEAPMPKKVKVFSQVNLSLTNDVLTGPARQDVYTLFKPRQQSADGTQPGPSRSMSSASKTLLSALGPSIEDGLTPSARLFTCLTKLDARSLVISTAAEFFLFMDMRKEFQWATFAMSPNKWVVATTEYNLRLGRINRAAFPREETYTKHPRALINKLADIEPNILNRLATQNFKSKRSGTESFWKTHCYAVNLGKHLTDATQSSSRKSMMCTRCKTLMYPNPSSKAKGSQASKAPGGAENHKRSMCSDGAPIKPNKLVKEVPPWPQPSGIFTNGTHFHVIPFLRMVQDLYRTVVQDGSTSQDLDIEAQAFADMLTSRTHADTTTGKVLFRLFEGLAIAEEDGFETSFIMQDGKRFLRIDCLEDVDG